MRKVGGVIIRPEEATCRSQQGGRVLDYLVVDARIAGAVERVTLDQGFPSSRHHPVRIRIRGVGSRDYVNALRRPASFGIDMPIGCMRMPQEMTEGTLVRLRNIEESGGRDFNGEVRQGQSGCSLGRRGKKSLRCC